ncbi:hypothetical protein BH18ACI1_BH18ACI1_23520 [soil metagenome]
MPRKKQIDNQYSENYQVIFKHLQRDDANASEISLIKRKAKK